MARGVNKVILVGNVGRDPEVRYSQGGGAIANVALATSDTWKDKNTGENQERTEWHRVVFFGRLGEIVGQYVKKGAKLYVEGSLRTRKWQDQSGQDRYTTEIVANEMQMLDSRNASSDGGYAPAPMDNYAPASNYSGAQGGSPQPVPQAPSPAAPPAGFDQFDDDIPF